MASKLIWNKTKIGDVFSKEIIAVPSVKVAEVQNLYGVNLLGKPLGTALRTQDNLLGYLFYYESEDFDFSKNVSLGEKFKSSIPVLGGLWHIRGPDAVLYEQVAADRDFTDPSRRPDLPFDQWHSLGSKTNAELARLGIRRGGDVFLSAVCTLLLPSVTGLATGSMIKNKVVSFALSAMLPTPVQDKILRELGVSKLAK